MILTMTMMMKMTTGTTKYRLAEVSSEVRAVRCAFSSLAQHHQNSEQIHARPH